MKAVVFNPNVLLRIFIQDNPNLLSEVRCESESAFCHLSILTNRMKRTPKKKGRLTDTAALV